MSFWVVYWCLLMFSSKLICPFMAYSNSFSFYSFLALKSASSRFICSTLYWYSSYRFEYCSSIMLIFFWYSEWNSNSIFSGFISSSLLRIILRKLVFLTSNSLRLSSSPYYLITFAYWRSDFKNLLFSAWLLRFYNSLMKSFL